MQKNKVIFFGTPSFSVPFLDALITDADFEVVGVVTEPDRESGRGKRVTKSAISKYIDSYLRRNDKGDSSRLRSNNTKIPIFKPEKISNIKSELVNLKSDIAVVVAYGQILPKEILGIPKYGFINVHPSNLPKYRGPAPIQTALLNGDKDLKASIMKMDEKMDHGPVLDKLKIEIGENDNYSGLEKKILDQSPIFMAKTIKKYLSDKIEPVRQNDSKATFTKLIKKKDGLIDWNDDMQKIHNKIRAYSSWPKAYTFLENGKRLLLLESNIVKDKLQITKVQVEGKQKVSGKDFLNGYSNLIKNEVLDKVFFTN